MTQKNNLWSQAGSLVYGLEMQQKQLTVKNYYYARTKQQQKTACF